MGLKERREEGSCGCTDEVWAMVREECSVGLQVAIAMKEERAQNVNRRGRRRSLRQPINIKMEEIREVLAMVEWMFIEQSFWGFRNKKTKLK